VPVLSVTRSVWSARRTPCNAARSRRRPIGIRRTHVADWLFRRRPRLPRAELEVVHGTEDCVRHGSLDFDVVVSSCVTDRQPKRP